MTVFSMANRTDFAPPGYLGGQAGALRQHRVNGAEVHPKGSQVLAPGDEITLVQAGGGGIGDPKTRDRALVARDLALGLVTPEGAVRDYGYVAGDE